MRRLARRAVVRCLHDRNGIACLRRHEHARIAHHFRKRPVPRRNHRHAACHRLKHEGGPTVRRWLETMDLKETSPAVREVHRQQVQYFRNHEHRMDYPTYVRNGWQIGSGPVESACKTVVGNRLKGGGMRWGEEGANAVCHLRALYLSEPACWDSFWNPPPKCRCLQT